MKAASRVFIIIFTLSFFAIITSHAKAEEPVNVIVKYRDSINSVKLQSTSSNFDVIKTTKTKSEDVIRELESRPTVEYAEEDVPVYLMDSPVVNDPDYFKQHSIYQEMSVVNAWEKYVPTDDVVVAVLDTGVDLNHPDLNSNIVTGVNLVDPSESAQDHNGHGTHVAGLIGAQTNNQIGISSISQGVKILPIKVFEGTVGQMSTVVKGIEFAVNHGADVINLSLGTYSNMKSMSDVIELASKNGVTVVTAAGNDNQNRVIYPAAYDTTIAVGSTKTGTNEKASFSNWGEEVDLNTPGTDIYSTWLSGYKNESGTSMSTAIVSSASGMILQNYPFLLNTQVKDVLKSSTDSVNQLDELGSGRLNVSSALGYVGNKNRIYGRTSVKTAVAVSEYGWKESNQKRVNLNGDELTGKFIILASGLTFPDSLAASPLSSYLDAPILLQQTKELEDANKNELKRLDITHVIIVGGSSAISEGVEHELTQLGLETIRLSGHDRYGTAVAINDAIPFETNEAMIVCGENFPDALSVAPYAGKYGTPVLFVQKNKAPEVVKSYLLSEGISHAYAIGGTGAMSDQTMNSLKIPFSRISGRDRYETNYKVVKQFGTESADALFIATGTNFPDALVGGALAAKLGGPVVLTHPQKMLSSVKEEFSFLKNKGLTGYHILGGHGAISNRIAWKIDEKLLY